MQENIFHPTSKESWKELSLLLAKEFGDGAEDILRFVFNIPAGYILSGRYTQYRIDANSSDEQVSVIAKIRLKKLVDENPSLALLELLGEKGREAIKKLGETFTTGKQGEIIIRLVS